MVLTNNVAGPAQPVPDEVSAALDARILRFIARPDSEAFGFEGLALDLFSYQFERNVPYRRYCEHMGRTPADVGEWQKIPAIPGAAFGDARIACFPPERAAVTFVSSGTTTGGAKPSRHELENTSLYDASLLTHFRRRVLPDAPAMQMVGLAPSFRSQPQSSLAYMLSKVGEVFGTPDSDFFIRDGELDAAGATAALHRAILPVLLIGTAFAFVHFIDWCAKHRAKFSLPAGSRLVETGGFKGKSREVPRDLLYADLSGRFGVPRALCLSEYGMCELGSQWYTANLVDHFGGRVARSNTFVGPHWARTVVVDPVSALPVARGATGLLAHYDLSNRGSVAAVLTADLGRECDGGFELLGRAPGARPKGCSTAIDAMFDGGE